MVTRRAPDHAALLRERGMHVTAQRLAVMRAVSATPHATADVVADAVRREIGSISLQSVYDALATLVGEGLLRRIQPAGSAARYEDRVGDNHHHLICRLCGRVVDVDCAVGDAPCLTASNRNGYDIDEAEVAYWGRCPECRATASKTRKTTHTRTATNPKRNATIWTTSRSAHSQAKRTPAGRTRTGGRTS